MDPISVSTYSLSAKCETEIPQSGVIPGSVRSLFDYEQRNLKNLLPQISATLIASGSHIVVGIALAYSAVLIPQLEDKNSGFNVTKNETSWMASVLALVTPLGCVLGAWMMDRWGRLNILKISIVPAIIGWILIATAQNVPMIIVGRVIAGLATPLATNPAIVYITEIARKDMRGSLLAIGPSYVSLGMVISYLKGWLMNWRTIAWLVNIYIIVPFFLIFILPESPVWLISKGRIEEARKSLNWFHKHQPKPEGHEQTFADLQLKLLIKEDEQKKREARINGGGKIREFMKPTGYKPLLLLCGIFLGQQFSGIYIFLFYSVTFFQDVGTSINPYIASILIGVIRLVMSLLNTWMLKYLGRRMLIMISASGMAVTIFISGLFTSWIKNGTTDLTWVPAIFLLLYVIFSMVGLLIIPWTLTAEFFPLKIRSMAHSISISVANFMLFLAVQNYVNMVDWFGGSAGVQYFFAAVSVLTVIYTFICMPETHRKKLSEIEDYFNYHTIYLCQKKKRRTTIAFSHDNDKNICKDSDGKEGQKLINRV